MPSDPRRPPPKPGAHPLDFDEEQPTTAMDPAEARRKAANLADKLRSKAPSSPPPMPKPAAPSPPPPPPRAPPRASMPPPAPAPAPAPRASAPAPAPSPTPSAPSVTPVEVDHRPRQVRAPNKELALDEAKRRSAAVAQDYLGQLVAGGLLRIPGVPPPSPRQRRKVAAPWKRRVKSLLLKTTMFAMLGLFAYGAWFGTVGRGRTENVRKNLAKAELLVLGGTAADLASADEALDEALEAKKGSIDALAARGEVAALALLLYGEGSVETVDAALKEVADRIEGADEKSPALRDYITARAARALAVLGATADADSRVAALRSARQDIDGALAFHPEDPMLRWLDGMAHWAAGDRERARVSLTKAEETGRSPVPTVTLGDLALDGGDVEAALLKYDKVLGAAPNHPLALMGRALARVEEEAEAASAMEDVNVGLSDVKSPRVAAYKSLTLASLYVQLEDYDKADEELKAASDSAIIEPRFRARVALLELDRGRIAAAQAIRDKTHWLGTETPDPLRSILDASLLMTRGRPDDALSLLGDTGGVRAELVRGRALLDLGRPAEAAKRFEKVIAGAPEDLRALAYLELARVMDPNEKNDASFQALQKLARGTVSTFPRYILGEAAAHMKKTDDAQRALEDSLEGNPLAYRAHVRLAMLYRLAQRYDDAEKSLDAALAQAPEFLPARAELGRLYLARGKVKSAAAELKTVVETGHATWEDELAYAEALQKQGDDDQAARALERARAKGAPEAEVLRVSESR